jgi:hypothetical protein
MRSRQKPRWPWPKSGKSTKRCRPRPQAWPLCLTARDRVLPAQCDMARRRGSATRSSRSSGNGNGNGNGDGDGRLIPWAWVRPEPARSAARLRDDHAHRRLALPGRSRPALSREGSS